jgi:hypothetical protein
MSYRSRSDDHAFVARPCSRTGEEYPDTSEGELCPEGCGTALSAEDAARGVCAACEEMLAEGAADGREDVARNGWPGEE